MKRRQFIKDVAAAGTAALLPATGSLVSGCSTPAVSDGWDFDEVLDRTGTWSIKYGRAADGQIPMWIADMDFQTAPAVSSALKERLEKDVLDGPGKNSRSPQFVITGKFINKTYAEGWPLRPVSI